MVDIRLKMDQIDKKSLDYLITQTKFLSSDFSQQEEKLGLLGDYITDDIANEWDWNTLCYSVNNLVEKGVLRREVIRLFVEIDKKFTDASKGGKFFSPRIWTLNGLKNDSFWEQQRIIAKKLLIELEKSKNCY